MWWDKRTDPDPLADIVTAAPPTARAMVVYGYPDLRVLVSSPCTEHDAVEVTENGDHFRRWRCVNCDQVFTTNERNPAYTGATTRLTLTCRECGEELPGGAAFCVYCSAPAGGA